MPPESESTLLFAAGRSSCDELEQLVGFVRADLVAREAEETSVDERFSPTWSSRSRLSSCGTTPRR